MAADIPRRLSPLDEELGSETEGQAARDRGIARLAVQGACVPWLGFFQKETHFACVKLKLPGITTTHLLAAAAVAAAALAAAAAAAAAAALAASAAAAVAAAAAAAGAVLSLYLAALGAVADVGAETHEPWVTFTNRLVVYLFADIEGYGGPDTFSACCYATPRGPLRMRCANPLYA